MDGTARRRREGGTSIGPRIQEKERASEGQRVLMKMR
jgi:hypothetical protein